MEQTAWQRYLLLFGQSLSQLQQQVNVRIGRFGPFYSLFLNIFKSMDKFANVLLSLADSIDQEILSTLTQEQKSLSSHFANLKSGIIGLVEAWRQVSVRSRNQLVEPLKTFQDNYRKLCVEGLTQLKRSFALCTNAEQQVVRCRDTYYGCCQKLQKHKEGQAKVMMRIEGGEIGQLQKFNRTTKTLLQRISSSQRRYKQQVERANNETEAARTTVQQQLIAFRNNETSRVQFFKKMADNQVRILDLSQRADLSPKQQVLPKIEPKGWAAFSQSAAKLQAWASEKVSEHFVAHQQLVKSKKMKEFQQQNPFLVELFQKVREAQKNSLRLFAGAVLELDPGVKLVSVQRPPREGRLVFPPEWQTFREKILSLHHYTFFFVHILSRHFSEMPNYYVKLSPPFFAHLRQFVSSILTRLNSLSEGTIGQTAISTIYQILKTSERVVERQAGRVKPGAIRILIEGLGQSETFKNDKIFIRLDRFLTRRSLKKKEAKGVVGFTKGLFSTLTGRKEELAPTEEEQFNALVELTHLMANLSLSTEVTLPFLKQILKNNQTSYQYLKDILINKRDREQRQKIVSNDKLKSMDLKKVLEGPLALRAVSCIAIIAQKGFFNLQNLPLRLICTSLKNLHFDIYYRMPVNVGKKWKWLSNPANGKNTENGGENEKGAEVQDIIKLDVQRSLHIHSERLPPQKLKGFLISYARKHSLMPYCQGMNYVAGLVLLKAEDDNSAYSFFCGVIDKLFLPVFIDNFSGMQLKLYILQRLISIFHPDLGEHLKREMITPECYAVGWIITAFSSAYQYTTKSYLIDWFWSRFVFWGWTEFYRLTLWLLQIYREQLMGAGYDKCLQVLGEIGRCPALLAQDRESFLEACSGDIQGAFQAFDVSNELLCRLEKEFAHE